MQFPLPRPTVLLAGALAALALPLCAHGAQSRGDWWRAFGDPELDRLCQAADAANPDIDAARARLAAARAVLGEARAGLSPQARIDAAASDASGPLINAAGSDGRLYQGGLVFTWELDLFHRLGDRRDAARLDAEARENLLKAARLNAEAETARAYLEARSLAAESTVVEARLAADDQALAVDKARFASGSVSEFDLRRSEAEVETVRKDLIELERRKASHLRTLVYLVDQAADQVRLDPVISGPVPPVPETLDAALLSRRPDVVAALLQSEAGKARWREARKAGLPAFAFTLDGALASTSIASLASASAQSWGLAFAASQPLFDGGARRSRAALRGAEADEAAALLQKALRTAAREAGDALDAVRSLNRQAALAAREAELADRAAELARSRFERGFASRLDLIDASRRQLQARRGLVQASLRRDLALVDLARALGGDWPDAAAQASSTSGAQP